MGDQSGYHGMYTPEAYSTRGVQQFSSHNNQHFYPPIPQGMAGVPQNYQMYAPDHPSAARDFPGVAQRSYQSQPTANDFYQYNHAMTSQVFPPQHQPSVRLPEQFRNVQQANASAPSPTPYQQQQFPGSRPSTPMSFNVQSNQTQSLSKTGDSAPVPHRYPAGPTPVFGPARALNPDRPGNPGSNTFPRTNFVQKRDGTSESIPGYQTGDFSASSVNPQNFPPTVGPMNVRNEPSIAPEIVPNFSQVPSGMSLNGQAVPGSSFGSFAPASGPRVEGGPDDPMLTNPLLKAAQVTGNASIVPSATSELPREMNETVAHAKQRKAGKYEEEEDDDDDDDYSERTETYSSETSSSSSSEHDIDLCRRHRHQERSTPAYVAQGHQRQVQNSQQRNQQSTRQQPAHQERSKNFSNSFRNMRIEKQTLCVDLFKEQNLIPGLDFDECVPENVKKFNPPSEILTSTLNIVPNSSSLLKKARLPFGILFQPLKEAQNLPQAGELLLKCHACKAFINPFVSVNDYRKWNCNLCYRQNELPEGFLYDQKTYTEGRHRAELVSPCYEFLLPERQDGKGGRVPVFVFLLDVSFNAVETGYLSVVCDLLQENLDELSKNPRSRVCFVTFNSHLHFYNLDHRLTQPHVYHVVDLEDPSPPCPVDGLMVNMLESRNAIRSFLRLLPEMHKDNNQIGNCLGTAVKTVLDMLGRSGGRVTVFQSKIPDVGVGSLKAREDPNRRASEVVQHLTPAVDFYKSVAVECSSKKIGFDLFFLNSQYVDMASINPIAKFTGGCIEYFPNFHVRSNPVERERLTRTFQRYLTREIGFDAILKIKCTRGLSMQTFHGNGFMSSVDMLTLPIINADAGLALQLGIGDDLEDRTASFQVILLYTNSRGERRIRIASMCLRVSGDLSEVFFNANQLAVTALVAKMAADRAMTSSVVDSREALVNVAADMLESFSTNLNSGSRARQLACPFLLRALPLLAFSLVKFTAFRLGISTKLDDRVHALEQLKTLPWPELLHLIYPHFYALHSFDDKDSFEIEGKVIYQPPMLPLTVGALDRQGIHLVDSGTHMHLWISSNIKKKLLSDVFDVTQFGSLREGLIELPELDNRISENIRNFIEYLNSLRLVPAPLVLIRDDSRDRVLFYHRLIEDRTADSLSKSYVEFLRDLHEKLSSSD